MQAILFALISFLSWGTGDIFSTIVVRKLGPYSSLFWSYVLGFLLGLFYIPVAYKDLFHLTLSIAIIVVTLSIFAVVGGFCFYEAVRVGNPALVGTISISYAPFVVLLSLVFLKEHITLLQALVILIIFIGLFLSALDFTMLKNRKFDLRRGVGYALVALLCWTLVFTFVKIPIREIGWFWPNYIVFFHFPLIFLFMKLKKIPLQLPTFNNALLPMITNVFLQRTAEFSYNIAVTTGQNAIVNPIVGSNSVLFVLLAFFLFRDPITKQQIAGIIVTLAGIVSLSFLSA